MKRHVLLLLSMCGMLSGCIFTPIILEKTEPSSSQARFEFEWVPQAELVRQQTPPDHQGKYAFQRGGDDLFVITRVTSVSDKRQGSRGAQRDKYIERVWISVPMGAPLNARLDLQELEEQFLVGYDRNNDDRGFYIRPCRSTGRMTVLERHDDYVLINIDAKVAPVPGETWRLTQIVKAPVAENGLRADAAKPVQQFHADVLYRNQLNIETLSNTPGPGETALDTTDDGQTDAIASRPTIVGKWFTQMGNWNHRYQFNPDGTFMFASSRGILPMVLEGDYEVKEGLLIITYKQFYQLHVDGHRADHMKFIRQRLTAAKINWVGGSLELNGQLAHAQTKPPYLFTQASYPDMRSIPPTKNIAGQ